MHDRASTRRTFRHPLVLLSVGIAACQPAASTPATSAPSAGAPAAARVSTAPWIDATASLDPATTPVYTGNAPMVFTFDSDMRKGAGYTLSTSTLGAHSGTHVDAPMHFVKDGASVDQLPIDPFIGPARVIDIADDVAAITAAELQKHPEWKGATRLLFRTRSAHQGWMSKPTFHTDFTYIAPDAAQLMADAGVVLVGIDYLSAEVYNAKKPETHWALLRKGIPVVEGLQLDQVPAGDYDLIVLPLKVAGHEGAPARAVLRPRPTKP
jgi:arylformamidase